MFPVRYEHRRHIKSKAVPVTVRIGLQSFKMLIPRCLANRLTDFGEVVSLAHRPCFCSPHTSLFLSLAL
jgi:hypothetical protein